MIHTKIENHEAAIGAFGHWPSFHDGIVYEFALFTNRRFKSPLNCARATIHGWNVLNEVDEKNHFKLVDHHLVTIEFQNIVNVLVNPGQVSILFSLSLYWNEDHWKVAFEGSGDFDATFDCTHLAVAGVIPCDKHGIPLGREFTAVN